MKIYKVQIEISGINDKPESREERIIAGGWQEVCELMARVCRDTGCVIRSMQIVHTDGYPFDYKTIKELDAA